MCKCGSLYPPSGWTMKSFMFLLQPLELIDLVIQRKLMFFRSKRIRFNPTAAVFMVVKHYGSANIQQTKPIQFPTMAEGLAVLRTPGYLYN